MKIAEFVPNFIRNKGKDFGKYQNGAKEKPAKKKADVKKVKVTKKRKKKRAKNPAG